jgi:hypothetical protein
MIDLFQLPGGIIEQHPLISQQEVGAIYLE